jgi:O-antigen/teichoic acid export membrane protein
MGTPSRTQLGAHGRALAEITLISGLGILATAGFQIVAARGLGTDEFGLLAAFLAIINVVAVGSSALRNSVAVATAAAPSTTALPARRRYWDGPAVEAMVLGGAATVVMLAVGPFLVGSLDATWFLVLLTALSIVPYFFFARAQGILQGVGATRSVVWWTTGSQLFQLALTVLAVLLGSGALGVLLAVLITAVAGTLGSSIQLSRGGVVGHASAFTANSIVVLVLTVLFAWMTNADVVLVRAGASAEDSGAYAAGAVLVKTMLIVPSILSLYLLPRFVRASDNRALTRQGLNLTLAFTLVTGALIFAGVWVLGGPIVQLLYGADYAATAAFLPWMALMCLPWSMAQAVLISLTAGSSRLGLVMAIVAAALQLTAFMVALPDVNLAIGLNAAVGVVTLIAFYAAHLFRSHSSESPATDESTTRPKSD